VGDPERIEFVPEPKVRSVNDTREEIKYAIWDWAYREQDQGLAAGHFRKDTKTIDRYQGIKGREKLQELRWRQFDVTEAERYARTYPNEGFDADAKTLRRALLDETSGKSLDKQTSEAVAKIKDKLHCKLMDESYVSQDLALANEYFHKDPKTMDQYQGTAGRRKLQELRFRQFQITEADRFSQAYPNEGFDVAARALRGALSELASGKKLDEKTSGAVEKIQDKLVRKLMDESYVSQDQALARKHFNNRDPKDIYRADPDKLMELRHLQFDSQTSQAWGWFNHSNFLEREINRKIREDRLIAMAYKKQPEEEKKPKVKMAFSQNNESDLIIESLWT
jgi:hypothetical protein